jgi:hypothetical protein
VLISTDDYLYFVDRALDGMAEVLTDLGDELANQRPDLAGANSAYVITFHCLGVLEFWVGHLVAGRPVERDRDAEFVASGPVSELVARIPVAKEQLRADLDGVEPTAPLRFEPPGPYLVTRAELTQSGALQHVYEELAQHLGQLELTRDLVRAK